MPQSQKNIDESASVNDVGGVIKETVTKSDSIQLLSALSCAINADPAIVFVFRCCVAVVYESPNSSGFSMRTAL